MEEFKVATARNHQSSVLEPGNLRFDILQSRDDPASFLLYEATRPMRLRAPRRPPTTSNGGSSGTFRSPRGAPRVFFPEEVAKGIPPSIRVSVSRSLREGTFGV